MHASFICSIDYPTLSALQTLDYYLLDSTDPYDMLPRYGTKVVQNDSAGRLVMEHSVADITSMREYAKRVLALLIEHSVPPWTLCEVIEEILTRV